MAHTDVSEQLTASIIRMMVQATSQKTAIFKSSHLPNIKKEFGASYLD
jgi:hypothetical protein